MMPNGCQGLTRLGTSCRAKKGKESGLYATENDNGCKVIVDIQPCPKTVATSLSVSSMRGCTGLAH